MVTHRTEEETPDRETQSCIPVDTLRDFLQPIEQGILLVDERIRCVFANRRACAVLSAETEAEAVGMIARSCPETVFEQSREKRTAITYLDLPLLETEQRKLIGLEV